MANAKKPYGLDRQEIERQIAIRAVQCSEGSLRNSISMARRSARYLAGVIRSFGADPLQEGARGVALGVFRERRVDCSIAAAALGRRLHMINAMADRFVETGLVGSMESALIYARLLTDHEREHNFETWRHGGWYVPSVRYPSGAIGCVSKNYPDGKWRIVCDPRRKDLGGEGDYTFGNRLLAAKAEQELATEQWMEWALNKEEPEEALIDRPRG